MDETEAAGKRIKRGGPVFGARRRGVFLEALAESGSVRHATLKAQVSPSTPYHARARDPDFAAEWETALATAYARLEGQAIEHCGGDPEGNRPFDFDRALKMIAAHEARARGARGHAGRVRIATRAETEAAVRRLLAAARRARIVGAPVKKEQ